MGAELYLLTALANSRLTAGTYAEVNPASRSAESNGATAGSTVMLIRPTPEETGRRHRQREPRLPTLPSLR